MINKDILYQYKNGNTSVTIYNDGTKVREIPDDVNAILDFPESIDIKITNYCDLNCSFCHELSTTKGIHGDLDCLFEKLKDLPSGVEYALGGGNPLSHPDLIPFLEKCKDKGWISNMTVNQKHLVEYDSLLSKLVDEGLIKGLGISVSKDVFEEKELKWKDYEHTVIHLIIGVHDYTIIDNLMSIGFNKFLLLGYKQFGRGINYYNKESDKIDLNIKKWMMFMPKYFNKCILSFDNLSIEQLNVKRFFDDKAWERFYMGDDFTHSMYIDAVKKEYAPTSRSSEREYYINKNLNDYFRRK